MYVFENVCATVTNKSVLLEIQRQQSDRSMIVDEWYFETSSLAKSNSKSLFL